MNQQQQLIRLINMRNAMLQRQAAIEKHNAAVRERNLAEQQAQQSNQSAPAREELLVVETFEELNNDIQPEDYTNYLKNYYEQSELLLMDQIEEDLKVKDSEQVQNFLSK